MSSLDRGRASLRARKQYQVELDEDSFAKLTSTRELEEWIRNSELPLSSPIIRVGRYREWARWTRCDGFGACQHLVAMPLYRHHLPLTVEGLETSGCKPPVILPPITSATSMCATLYTALPHHGISDLHRNDEGTTFVLILSARPPFIRITLAALTYFLTCSIYNGLSAAAANGRRRRALTYTAPHRSWLLPIVFRKATGRRTEVETVSSGYRDDGGGLAFRSFPSPFRPLRDLSCTIPGRARGPVHVSIAGRCRFPRGLHCGCSRSIERL